MSTVARLEDLQHQVDCLHVAVLRLRAAVGELRAAVEAERRQANAVGYSIYSTVRPLGGRAVALGEGRQPS